MVTKAISSICLTLVAVGAAGTQPAPRIVVGPNVLVSWEGGGTLWEVMIAANPINPKNLLGGGIFHRTLDPRGGQENRGYYSLDGGYSWRATTFAEQLANGGGDPQAAFGRTGTAYFTTISFGDGRIRAYRSEDGGATWGPPFDIGPGDHEMIVVDHTNGRFAGRAYLGLLGGSGHGQLDYHIKVFRSLDDGRTWIGPVDVTDNHATPKFGRQVLNMLLFRDGELFVPIVDFAAADDVSAQDSRNFWFSRSNDGGATFTPVRRFKLASGGELSGPRAHFPMFAVDQTEGPFRDRVYVVWPDGIYQGPGEDGRDRPKGTRLLLSYSDDRGDSWSDPKQIAPWKAGIGDQDAAMIAVNNEGTVAVTWYDTRDTPAGAASPLVHRYLTGSVDGSRTFLPARPISSEPSDLAVLGTTVLGVTGGGNTVSVRDGGSLGGHYLGLTADAEGTFHPFWPDGRTGSSQLWTARVRVERATAASPAANPSLVESDVTERLRVRPDPIRERSAEGVIEIGIRLENISKEPIYGPLSVEVTAIRPDAALLNAMNGKSGVGAVVDYARAFGDLDALPPGGISEAIVWRFRAPAGNAELPRVTLKVKGRVAGAVRR